MRQYLSGERVDVQAIAARLGLGRTTVYRWFGSREQLIGEVLVRAALPELERACAEARGRGGRRLLDTFDRFNRALADAPALRRFVEHEREAALRILTAGDGPVQPRMVAAIEELIENEVSAGSYEPHVEPGTLAYAIVRLAEAFLFNEAAAGIRGDVDRLATWRPPCSASAVELPGDEERPARRLRLELEAERLIKASASVFRSLTSSSMR